MYVYTIYTHALFSLLSAQQHFASKAAAPNEDNDGDDVTVGRRQAAVEDSATSTQVLPNSLCVGRREEPNVITSPLFFLSDPSPMFSLL